jgi:hypothetical protein
MVFGGLMGAAAFVLGFFKDQIAFGEQIAASPVLNLIYNACLADFMLTSFGMFCLCVVTQVVATLVFAEPPKEEARGLIWEHWTEPLRVKCGRGLSDYRVMSGVVLVIFVTLYFIFH